MCSESGLKYELQNEIYYSCTFNLEMYRQFRLHITLSFNLMVKECMWASTTYTMNTMYIIKPLRMSCSIAWMTNTNLDNKCYFPYNDIDP
jgi:hypothetical protein